MSPSSKIIRQTVALVALVAIIYCSVAESKLLRRSRYYDDPYEGPYAGATGERALMTIRGVRNPYDGSAPSKIAIEDNPHRGPYPRGVYDRIDSGYGRGRPTYPYDGGYMNYNGYNSGYNGGYGYGGPMYGAPNRIRVTGVYPYGYGSRF